MTKDIELLNNSGSIGAQSVLIAEPRECLIIDSCAEGFPHLHLGATASATLVLASSISASLMSVKSIRRCVDR